ncbi:MAG: response regulator transcription factor [Bacteroidota bacterium]
MENKLPKILLAEDDETLGYLLREFLISRNFEVEWAKDGVEALRKFNAASFDLCVLDVMMPALDGFTVGELQRQKRPDLPLIFLTAKSLPADVQRGFKAGADDYIKKPVNEEELVVRIQAVLKRSGAFEPTQNEEQTVFQIGDYLFDSQKLLLRHGEEERILTDREAAVLRLLAQSQGNLVPRELVLQKLWGRQDFLARKSMDVFIARLRKYLAKDARIQIQNIHGSGFLLILN